MAKITAKTISKDIDIVKHRVQDITVFVDKTKYEYIKTSKTIKSNLSLLKQLKKRSKVLENELETIEQERKKDLEIIDKNKQKDQKKQEIESPKQSGLLEKIIDYASKTAMVGVLVAEQQPQGEKPNGSNGKLKPEQLKDVGDGFKLWLPAADSYLQMKAAAAKDKVYFKLSSAYRTYEEQAKLEEGLGTWSPTNPGAAPPGTSAHGWGIAIDISSPGAQQWIKKYGGQYGWYSTVSNEPWHFEWKGSSINPPQSKNTPILKNINANAKTNIVNLISTNTETESQSLIVAVMPAPEDPGIPAPMNQHQPLASSNIPLNNNTTNPFFITPTG